VFDHVTFKVPFVVELPVAVLTLEFLHLVSLGRVAEFDVFPQSVLFIQQRVYIANGRDIFMNQYQLYNGNKINS
jgi:hypothetical protein